MATDLVKRYGTVRALEGFTLSVAAGEIVGLVGHNGAGKSTFVEIVSNLVRPDSGTVSIDGRPPAAARGRIGVSPQHISLYPSCTVREHLELYGKLAGLRGPTLREAVDELAVVLRLTEIMDRRTGKLSGGQQRRTQAASALVHRPPLLLLDEPTAGADLETREAILDVVKQRAGEGAAVVYTTHYLPELTELRATIAVARDGRIIAHGSYEELVNDLPGEVRVRLDSEEEISVSTHEPTVTLMDLLRQIDRPISSVDVRHPSLDDLYRSLAVHDAP
ncbi:ABC transporter ATP-binding protein [Microbispora oryzae]|uniref:ABC transporter ATP-binding protein n=1 Tax=Microbispora oryzae TaxID=2806554 RepID=UPI0027DCCB43|nr:ABC transporter ATP-binding protein [Microbispora oryzae]